MAKILDEMDELYDTIYENRCKIAHLKKDKIEVRSDAWSDATGIADQKKDYVRSCVANMDESIDLCEAEIERAYNKIKLWTYKMESTDE